MGNLAYIPVGERSLALDIQALANQFVRLDVSDPSRALACTVTWSLLFENIRDRQYDDPHLLVLETQCDTVVTSRGIVRHSGAKQVTVGDDEVLRMQDRICMPNVDGLRELFLEEAHSSRYSIHSGATEMYRDLRQHYWWRRMKKDIIGGEGYVARCLNCQQLK
ncbi:uncharacterized protein [Nicotiana sylvestris]|uniref:uncharacterized protein n=1 Tax=Nicotiana sylvestris TaxID=4096 RepID=UPI00388C986F